VTKQEMGKDDLIEVRTGGIVQPRDTTGSSIPGILSTLYNVCEHQMSAFPLFVWNKERRERKPLGSIHNLREAKRDRRSGTR